MGATQSLKKAIDEGDVNGVIQAVMEGADIYAQDKVCAIKWKFYDMFCFFVLSLSASLHVYTCFHAGRLTPFPSPSPHALCFQAGATLFDLARSKGHTAILAFLEVCALGS